MKGTTNDDIVALTYTLIYNFLLSRGDEKAARTVKKAAKPIVNVNKGAESDLSLVAIILKWRELTATVESSEEESSSSEVAEDEHAAHQTAPVPAPSSDTSDDEDEEPVNVVPQKVDNKAAAPNALASSSAPVDPVPIKVKGAKKRKRSENADNEAPQVQTTPSQPNVANAIPTSAADTPSEPAKKKQRGDPDVELNDTSAQNGTDLAKQNGGKAKPKIPFSRIKVDEVEFHDERLKNNAFEARGASSNDYGAQAHKDLIVTKGAGFRKEKNKKKRGSYRGGEITMQSHSIKFD